jgi:hypothetical protein
MPPTTALISASGAQHVGVERSEEIGLVQHFQLAGARTVVVVDEDIGIGAGGEHGAPLCGIEITHNRAHPRAGFRQDGVRRPRPAARRYAR